MSNQELIEIDNITGAFEILLDSVESYEQLLMEQIAILAIKEKNTQGIKDAINQVEQVKGFIDKINRLKNNWVSVFGKGTESSEEEMGTTDISATARTSWQTIDGKIRIETERPEGPPYSNVFPLSLFKDITKFAVDIIEK